MKKRDYKSVGAGTIHHVFNRGNNREVIFLDNQDRRAFLFRLGMVLGIKKDLLSESEITTSPKSRIRIVGFSPNTFKILAFCLMPTHFHLLVEQTGDISISKLIHKICTSYSMYANKRYRRVGHIFQDRFKSVLIESDPQLMWVSAYIHSNPVKDNLVDALEDYVWSSYRDFTTNRKTPFLDDSFLLEKFGSSKNFMEQNTILSTNMPRRVLGSLAV